MRLIDSEGQALTGKMIAKMAGYLMIATMLAAASAFLFIWLFSPRPSTPVITEIPATIAGETIWTTTNGNCSLDGVHWFPSKNGVCYSKDAP